MSLLINQDPPWWFSTVTELPSIFDTLRYEMQEKKSLAASFFASQSGLPVAAVLFVFDAAPLPVFPPTAALKMKDALSTNIFVTSSADFDFVALSRSVTYKAGWLSYITLIILSEFLSSLITVNAIDLSLNSLINGSSSNPLGSPSG